MEQTQSLDIGELVAALAAAQGRITGALKDSANPFYKSKYADLASVWDACRGPLSENGLAVIQTTEPSDHGVTIITTLAHKSGQWIRGRLTMTPKDGTPQSYGSCLTYGRRYALASIVGVAQVDDDGNAASGVGHTKADPLDRENLTVTDAHRKYALAFLAPDADYRTLYADVHSEGEEFTRCVWSLLDSKTRSAIKRAVGGTPA